MRGKMRHWHPPHTHDFLEASKTNKGCVTHYGLAIYIKRSILRQKKNYENSNISPCKNIINLSKKSSKRNQNPSRHYYYYNSIITNLKFQHKPKYIIFQKSSYNKNSPIIIIIIIIT
jgi:hypothetical protein